MRRCDVAPRMRQTGQKPAGDSKRSTLFVAQCPARKPRPPLTRPTVHSLITETRTTSANSPRAPLPLVTTATKAAANNRTPTHNMAGQPLRRARREEREADQLATYETVKRSPLPDPRSEPAAYEPALIGELLALAANGYSSTEIAAHWAISEETLAEWGKAHQELATALNHARTREKAWWFSRARLAIASDNNRFPAGAWSHVMRARFPDEYGDKGHTITLDLGSLVVIHRAEPLGERAVHGAKPLIEGRVTQLPMSLTGEGSADPNPSDADGGDLQSDGADPGRAGG